MTGTDYLLAIFVAMAVCMSLIPLLVRTAPRFGLLDMPDPRKVHAVPVPRVGGLAIVLGSLVAMLLLLPLDRLMQAYLLGVAVLAVLGVWDDITEIGHYKKFAGQFLAVMIIVLYGGLHVTRLPFGWENVPAAFGIPFTIFALVGMINAINHSDGLDGLAGGESLLSLIAIGYLAHLAGGGAAVIITAAVVGGVLGFLRFNTFPARLFMGDAGSQVLGLTLGFLVIWLTQEINPVLSAAVPALLLGLPVCDILGVLYLRIRHGMNWFRASKNHIHHRLLALGFAHHESVVVIYSIQALLVLLGVVLRYQTDALILGLYLLVVAVAFTALTVAERGGWRADQGPGRKGLVQAISGITRDPRLSSWSLAGLWLLIPGWLLVVSMTAATPPGDMSVAATVMFVVMALDLWSDRRGASVFARTGIYVTVVFTVYLGVMYTPAWLHGQASWVLGFFGLVAALIAINLRFRERGSFELTPLDFLVVCAVIGVVVIGEQRFFPNAGATMAVEAVILVYGCELLLSMNGRRLTILRVATVVSLGVIFSRGLF